MLTDQLIFAAEEMINKLAVVPREQLERYFRVRGEGTLKWCLDTLVRERRVNYDERTDSYRTRQFDSLQQDKAEAQTAAGWILANWGEERVTEYLRSVYPTVLIVILDNEKVFDITVVDHKNARQFAYLAPRIWSQHKLFGKSSEDIDKELLGQTADDIMHIVLLPDQACADQHYDVLKANFDIYCVLDAENQVSFDKFK